MTMEGLKGDSGEVFGAEKIAKWALTIHIIDGWELVDVTKAAQLGPRRESVDELTMEGCRHHRILIDNDNVVVYWLV
jgi:hypothetical protein